MTVDGVIPGLVAATASLDHEDPIVQAFVDRTLAGRRGSPRENAVSLYYAVRDQILYDVYDADLSRDGLRASSILSRGRGFCLHKSIVYAAACRAVGIPSRLVFADVRNHLASGKLRDLVGGNLFFHGLTSVWVDGRWMKATPVFNKMLCRLYRMAPLEFDGTADSLYQPYDAENRRHMEFVKHYGEFDDFPYEMVIQRMHQAHPKLFSSEYRTTRGSLVYEAPFTGSSPS
ncbi:MAG: transglutaminase-like domain-containing protein [Jatrophihabitantaceae bacterium]